ncbi:MAG TPA: AAA family ATPase [Candidatus Paceibacterota bacterium]
MQKLIIIRGNSGSGKSAVAERLREELDGKVALIGQDTLRRTILGEADSLDKTDIIGLLEQTLKYCLEKGYSVILEGILSKPKYKDVLVRSIDTAPCDSYIFYIDVSMEESLQRHKTKPIATEVSEEKLRSWYQPQNYLDVLGEVVIGEESTLEETVELIKNSIKF